MRNLVLVGTVLAGMLLVFNGMAMVLGFSSAASAASSSGCGTRLNITYVLPAYEVGCWLGSPK